VRCFGFPLTTATAPLEKENKILPEGKVVNLKHFERAFITCVLTGALLSLLSCSSSSSSGSKTPPPQGLVFTTPTSSPSIDAGQTVTLTVSEGPVNWMIQVPFGYAQGQLTNQSNTSVTYVAPAAGAIGSTIQENVVATLTVQSGGSQSASMPVTVNTAPTVGGTLAVGAPNTSCNYNPITGVGDSNANLGQSFSQNDSPSVIVSGGTAPYTWSLASDGSALPTGLQLVSSTDTTRAFWFGTASGVGCSKVTAQVTDATGSVAQALTTYFIVAPAPLKVSPSNYPDAFQNVPYPPTAVTVSGGVPPYTWNTAAFNSSSNSVPNLVLSYDPSNSFYAVISGTPTLPASDNGGGTYSPGGFVYDSQQPYPAVGSFQMSLFEYQNLPPNACQPPDQSSPTVNNSNMVGSYAFLMQGFDSNGPVVFAGSFAADGNGNITGGVLDQMTTSSSNTGISINSGTYSLIQQETEFANGAGGCLTFSYGTGSNVTFAISMGGCTTGSSTNTNGNCPADQNNNPGIYQTGRLIEFDDKAGSGIRASGFLRLQDSSVFASGMNGMYAFGLRGWDSANQRFAEAGSFSASSGNLSSIAADVNDGGNVQSALTGGTGTVSAADMNTGRSTASLSVSGSSLNNLVVYVVSAKEAILLNTGALASGNPIVAGEAVLATRPFNYSSLQNSHMFRMTGLAPSGADPNIGILQFDGAGGYSGTQYEDQGGTLSTTTLSGNYIVAANSGRVEFIPSTTTLPDHPLVAYVIPESPSLTRQDCAQLANCVTGFLISTDASVQAGQLEFQTPSAGPPPPFSNEYLLGFYFYGTDEMMDTITPAIAGLSLASPSSSSWYATQSLSEPTSYCAQLSNCTPLIPNDTIRSQGGSKYSVSSNGSGSIGGNTVAVTNGNVTFYIDESPINLHPSVIVVEQ
jgi:hypothetical protein